ncbi:MAG: hypothetical protein ACJAS1_002634, partial [Oleiphilaceae bacterium]
RFEQIEALKVENALLRNKLEKQLAFYRELGVRAAKNPSLLMVINQTVKDISQGKY